METDVNIILAFPTFLCEAINTGCTIFRSTLACQARILACSTFTAIFIFWKSIAKLTTSADIGTDTRRAFTGASSAVRFIEIISYSAHSTELTVSLSALNTVADSSTSKTAGSNENIACSCTTISTIIIIIAAEVYFTSSAIYN